MVFQENNLVYCLFSRIKVLGMLLGVLMLISITVFYFAYNGSKLTRQPQGKEPLDSYNRQVKKEINKQKAYWIKCIWSVTSLESDFGGLK